MSSKEHFLMIRASNCGMAAFRDGEWKVVDSHPDSDALVDKLNEAKPFLEHFDGEAVLMMIRPGGGEFISARFNVKGTADSSRTAKTLNDDDRRMFWNRVQAFRLYGPASLKRAAAAGSSVVRHRVAATPAYGMWGMGAGLVAAGVAGFMFVNQPEPAAPAQIARVNKSYVDANAPAPLAHPRDMMRGGGVELVKDGIPQTFRGRLNAISKSWGTK